MVHRLFARPALANAEASCAPRVTATALAVAGVVGLLAACSDNVGDRLAGASGAASASKPTGTSASALTLTAEAGGLRYTGASGFTALYPNPQGVMTMTIKVGRAGRLSANCAGAEGGRCAFIPFHATSRAVGQGLFVNVFDLHENLISSVDLASVTGLTEDDGESADEHDMEPPSKTGDAPPDNAVDPCEIAKNDLAALPADPGPLPEDPAALQKAAADGRLAGYSANAARTACAPGSTMGAAAKCAALTQVIHTQALEDVCEQILDPDCDAASKKAAVDAACKSIKDWFTSHDVAYAFDCANVVGAMSPDLVSQDRTWLVEEHCPQILFSTKESGDLDPPGAGAGSATCREAVTRWLNGAWSKLSHDLVCQC